MAWRRQRRRFYREAAVEAKGAFFVVTLDGRPVRTPAGGSLRLPSRALAEAIAAEWQDQEGEIIPEIMPLTQLAITALDRIALNREAVVAELLKYAETDLVCYRADGPADLVNAQHRCWQPLVDWLGERWQAPLAFAIGVIPLPQPPASIAALRRALEGYGDLALVGIASVVQTSGSLVIGLALADGRLDAEAAAAAALLDEEYQAERWGRDEPAEARRARLRQEIKDAERFLHLLGAAGLGRENHGTQP
jgi:chaperone required for assembly of F1-ATPase